MKQDLIAGNAEKTMYAGVPFARAVLKKYNELVELGCDDTEFMGKVAKVIKTKFEEDGTPKLAADGKSWCVKKEQATGLISALDEHIRGLEND